MSIEWGGGGGGIGTGLQKGKTVSMVGKRADVVRTAKCEYMTRKGVSRGVRWAVSRVVAFSVLGERGC